MELAQEIALLRTSRSAKTLRAGCPSLTVATLAGYRSLTVANLAYVVRR